MAKERRNGIQTKQNIINAAKRMFYENGYLDTLYEDICREANVNAGAMYYHFKSKGTIAGKIYTEFIEKNRKRILEVLPKDCNSAVSNAVEIRAYLHLLFTNRKLLRFFHDIYLERIPNILGSKTIEDFYVRLKRDFEIDDKNVDLRTIAVGAAGFQGEITINYYEGLLHDSDEFLIDYYLKMRFSLMELPLPQIDLISKKSKELFDLLECSIENYFEPIYRLKERRF